MNNTANKTGSSLLPSINILKNKNGSNSRTNNTSNTSNTSKTTNTSGTSTTSIVGIVILIIVIIIVLASAYWFYTNYSKRSFIKVQKTEVLKDVSDAASKVSIASGLIPSSNYSNEYSISFWMNVNDFNYNYGKEKIIMRRGPGNPEILLDAKTNDLIVRVKLQGPAPGSETPTTTAASSRSAFTDIPNFIMPAESRPGEIITGDEPFYTYGKFKTSSIPFANCNEVDANKIGSNEIDYPTVKYLGDSNNFFSLVSGNKVSYGKEGFTDMDDAIAATLKFTLSICDVASTIQSADMSTNTVSSLNLFFDTIIKTLEDSRKTTQNVDDISTTILSSFNNMPDLTISKTLMDKVQTLADDYKELDKYNNIAIDMNRLKNELNNKLKEANCPLSLEGSTDVDSAITFNQKILELIKKSLLTYIYNMGDEIKKTYPELDKSPKCEKSACGIVSDSSDPSIGTCVAKMVPLQKWVNVIVSVYNQVVDIYIDGQLNSSCVLAGFPDISSDSVEITPDGGFAGNISRVVFSNSAMTVSEAQDIYMSGPVPMDDIFSMIPSWVWYGLVFLVIIMIIYSVFL